MNLYSVSLVLLLLWFFSSTITASTDDKPFHPTGEVSINCGSIRTIAARNGREWQGDGRKSFSSVKIEGSSTTSYAINQNLVSDPVPYQTARISRSQFSYKLQINPGQKILRFHFNAAAPYKGFKQYKDLFDVEAGPFTLLSNFSATLAADALGVSSIIKEFCIDIKENNQMFKVTFTPTSSQSRDTYGFINGIEIVSVPASQSYFHMEDVGVQLIGKSPVNIDSSRVIEIIRRLNSKQELVSLSSDSIGERFQSRGNVAEEGGKEASNITSWKIPVDVGFRYVVRLHFSRMGFKIADMGGFRFQVLINGRVAANNSDTFKEREEDGSDWYRDYSVVMTGSKLVGRRDLLISMLSNDAFLDGHGPLKGFEVLKLSNPDNSLASPNPLRFANPPFYQTQHIIHKILGRKNAIVNCAILVLVLLNITLYMLWMIQEASLVEQENMHCAEEESMPSVKVGRLCRRFSLAEIQSATQNFSRGHLIGRGGFGKVYKGTIDNGKATVAIKRLKSNSSQGAREFLTEIETLTELRHVNLVSLIGYCNEGMEMILVYEYMASGSLADRLFKIVWDDDNTSSLTWKQCLNICIGAARGLDYLHTGLSIIHRDVKASNILLGEDFTAKIADFGLAKHLNPDLQQQSHVSTKVRGTFGYLDPEYLVTGKLTMKSDTYAFGVVLLEVLCGRRAIDGGYLEEERNLTKWALEKISMGEPQRIVASNLKDEISEKSLKAFVGVAERCLHTEPKKRPTMAQVVLRLQFVLDLLEGSISTYTVSDYKSLFNDIHPLDDETPSSSSSVKHGEASEGENLLPAPVKEQCDDQVLASENVNTPKQLSSDQVDNNVVHVKSIPAMNYQSKTRMTKTSKLWPWGAFRKKGESVYSNSTSCNKTVDMKFVSVQSILFIQLKDVLHNFSQNSTRGEDFYHGVLKSGQAAAIKVLRYDSDSKEKFLDQVSLMSSLKHENLAELFGYRMDDEHGNLSELFGSSCEGPLKILAYEYAPNGSLHDILHGSGRLLSWSQRVKIAVDAAKGLQYLHEMYDYHGHFKSSNILIFNDAKVAKITDFHKSTWELDNTETRAFTLGFHTRRPGYLLSHDEPRAKTSDVYSFGVVLLELLTGRKVFDDKAPKDQQYLAYWALRYLSEGKLKECVDGSLKGRYLRKAVAKMAVVATSCLQYNATDRPPMNIILKDLKPLLNTVDSLAL